MAPRSSQAAVENGVLKRVSPSQVKEYEQCPRKWYFTKVQGLPVVSRNQRQLDFGSALHKEIENFILQGTPLTTPLAIVGKEHIPTATNLLVETRVEDPWVYAAGIYVDGYIDLVVPGPVPEIIDWKTTSDIDKWGKTSEELRTDTQMLTYAKWALAKYAAESVRLSHVQFQTKGRPWASKKSTVLTLDETNQAWLKVNHTVAQMTVDAGAKTPADVVGNTDACDNYGGCPFQHVCPSHTRGKDMASLLEKLRGKTADVKPVEVQMKYESKPEVRPLVANTPMIASLEKSLEHVRGEVQKRGLTVDMSKVSPPEDFTPPDMPGEELAVMPSKQALPDAVLAEANKALDEAYPTKAKGRPKGAKNKPKAVTAAVETQADETNHPEDHTGEGEPLTDADIKALSDADIQALAESVGAMAGLDSGVALKSEFEFKSPRTGLDEMARLNEEMGGYAAVPKFKELRLFINCYPSTPSQDLTAYVNGLNIEASNQEKIPDVRLSESKMLGFGKWKGVLAQLAKAAPPTGDCYISSSDLNDPVIEALIPLAALVVRAR